MVLAHYFREDGRKEGYEKGLKLGRENARAKIEKEKTDKRLAELKAENEELRWRINEIEHGKMQAELDDLRKRVEALEAAQSKQASE